ncbi:hypothetical protein PILCRDRAFT_747669 [Piloderma croceum F 1598]|uniref:Uncharacterized protein n=1 Tax=Piloderma croceum (strain F 1598) TaxID=765440 RepID=A0A0C3ADP3_PILCF|nr:hypothetical protein PILCRDRAFT_747669 [Piloderma croceum F 1598]
MYPSRSSTKLEANIRGLEFVYGALDRASENALSTKASVLLRSRLYLIYVRNGSLVDQRPDWDSSGPRVSSPGFHVCPPIPPSILMHNMQSRHKMARNYNILHPEIFGDTAAQGVPRASLPSSDPFHPHN